MSPNADWYYAQGGQSYGPMTLEQLRERLGGLDGERTLVYGPGELWFQSLPFSRLAGRIVAAAPQTGHADKGEGSILGGLGRLLDGDNR